MQSWWRKAGNLGLRKKKYIRDTKTILFNLELLPFMNLKEAHIFYKIINDKFSINSQLENFYDYFEDTWLSLTDSDKTKFDFYMWNYKNKFNFKGNKYKLLNDDELSNYILFSNNACESFIHLINQCISSNTRVNIVNFEEVLKFIFIRMESNNDSNKKKKEWLKKY